MPILDLEIIDLLCQNKFNKVLYLNDKYNSTLNFFFNEEDGKYHCIRNTAKEMLEKKRIFLGSYINLVTKNWCNTYYSFPYIEKIVFNSDLSKAKIFFRNSFSSGGGMEYLLINGNWTFTKQLLSWSAIT